MREPYPDLKAAVVEALTSQDEVRGPPRFEHYDCTYLLLYPEEEVYVTGLGTKAGLARGGGEDADGVYRQRDLSNRVKLIEDALFSYFRVNDTRTFDLHAHKRAVARLPFQPSRFSEDIFGREVAGVLLIAVRESTGPLLTEDDPLCQLFGGVLQPKDFLTELKGTVASSFPEWFDPSRVTSTPIVHPVADARFFAKLTKIWDKSGFRQDMLASRIAWLAAWAGRDTGWAAECLFDRTLLKRAWRKLAKQRKVLRAEEQAAFDCGWEWAYRGLADECLSPTLVTTEYLYQLATQHNEPRSVLVVGPGVGTFAYPFIAARHSVTVVTRANSAEEAVFLARLEQDQYQCGMVQVSDWEQGFDVGGAKFDLVICIGLLERVADREHRLLHALGSACSGRMILTAAFRQRPGQKRSGPVEYPWVFADPEGEQSRRDWLLKYVASRKGLGFEQTPGTDFRGRLCDFSRST